MIRDFSVLMSVYHKEKAVFLREALNSLTKSVVPISEVVLVEDGPIGEELQETIEEFKELLNIKSIKLDKNSGLAIALNEGLKHCDNELVARMDTDDVINPQRFLKQLKVFNSDDSIVLTGSNVEEFIESSDFPIKVKKMPVNGEQIYSYSRKRNPFNHPTVMFKKSSVLSVGSYKNMPLFEDYYLWLRMLGHYDHNQFININEPLVKMRTVPDLYRRRGGFSYVGKVKKFRKQAYNEKLISCKDYLISTYAIAIVAILPNKVREVIYQKLLREDIKG